MGDVLYHGPRNDLPKGYAPKEVISMLNDIKQEILCVRGNCDTEVDQMVLEFPVLAEYAIMYYEGKMMFFTHGHILNESKPPMLKKGDVCIFKKGDFQRPMGVSDCSYYFVHFETDSFFEKNILTLNVAKARCQFHTFKSFIFFFDLQ